MNARGHHVGGLSELHGMHPDVEARGVDRYGKLPVHIALGVRRRRPGGAARAAEPEDHVQRRDVEAPGPDDAVGQPR